MYIYIYIYIQHTKILQRANIELIENRNIKNYHKLTLRKS